MRKRRLSDEDRLLAFVCGNATVLLGTFVMIRSHLDIWTLTLGAAVSLAGSALMLVGLSKR